MRKRLIKRIILVWIIATIIISVIICTITYIPLWLYFIGIFVIYILGFINAFLFSKLRKSKKKDETP
jgi:hypothetical protein